MRKAILVIAGILAITVTGCGGEAPTPSVDGGGVEEIRVEEIRVEEIRVEEIQVETIDDEFARELKYNSKVNTWENSTTYWD